MRKAILECAAFAAVAYVAACGGEGPIGPSGPPAPAVYSITPAHGPASGGTSVRIGGANFAQGVAVTIGGALATEVVVESSASITARTPAHAPGAGDVIVSTGGKTATLPGGFTYDAGQPPVINAITVRGTKWPNEPGNFADLGELVNVTASVQDADTATDQLKFEWTSDSGTFTGTGAAVQWAAPTTTATTPAQVTLTLAVTDGASRVTSTVAIRLHDSVKEVGDLARLFLADFSNSNNSPDYVLRNFSTGPRCIKERDDEKGDIQDNRERYQILSSSIGGATVNFQFAGRPCSYTPVDGDSCAAVRASWTSRCLKTNEECKEGDVGTSGGTDFVTAVYEESQWKLCASKYKGDANSRFRFFK